VSTNDPEAARQLFRPGDNIGLDCGKSRLVVIDKDRHGEADGFATWERLKVVHGFDDSGALRSRTGGGGRHLLFLDTTGGQIRNSQGKLGPGIDVRGNGGYIVLPPSWHPNGKRYRAEGDWNREPGVPPDALKALLLSQNESDINKFSCVEVCADTILVPLLEFSSSGGGAVRNRFNTKYRFPIEQIKAEILFGKPRRGCRNTKLIDDGLSLAARALWGEREGFERLVAWIMRADDVSPHKTRERLRQLAYLWRYDAKRILSGHLRPMIGQPESVALLPEQREFIASAIDDLPLKRERTRANLARLIEVYVGVCFRKSVDGRLPFFLATRAAASLAFGSDTGQTAVRRLIPQFIDNGLRVFETVQPATARHAARLVLCETWRLLLTRQNT